MQALKQLKTIQKRIVLHFFSKMEVTCPRFIFCNLKRYIKRYDKKINSKSISMRIHLYHAPSDRTKVMGFGISLRKEWDLGKKMNEQVNKVDNLGVISGRGRNENWKKDG